MGYTSVSNVNSALRLYDSHHFYYETVKKGSLRKIKHNSVAGMQTILNTKFHNSIVFDFYTCVQISFCLDHVYYQKVI